MDALGDRARTQGDDPAIVSEFGDRTFAELDGNVNRLIRMLRSRGLETGDAVALVCGNRPEFAEVLNACLRGGFRLTPVNWHLTADEVGYVVEDCQAAVLFAEAGLDNVGTCAADVLGSERRLAIGGDAEGWSGYADAIAEFDAGPIEPGPRGSTMLYTSGTTGRPKGVQMPPADGNAKPFNIGGYDESGGDAHLCTGPLYHAAPMSFSLLIPLSLGATVVMMRRWDAADALRLIERHSITHSHMVPTMFHRLLALADDVRASADVSSLRYVIHGAAPCPQADKRRIIEWFGPIVWEYYAATEGTGTAVDSTTWLAHPGTVGKPLVDGLVRVCDEEGEPVPAGEVGLVFLRAPAARRFTYFNDRAKTDGAFRGEYFTLGDVGYLDEEGYLYLTDRTTDLIISGGVNIYPAEIDAVLIEHPSVADVATVGVPDEEWGESVLSVIELNVGYQASTDLQSELSSLCRQRLAAFKCPRRFEFVDDLPRSDAGKVAKRILRDEYR